MAEVKMVAFGTMPDEATQATIEAYLARSDRISATEVRWIHRDSERERLQKENNALKVRIQELEAQTEESV